MSIYPVVGKELLAQLMGINISPYMFYEMGSKGDT